MNRDSHNIHMAYQKSLLNENTRTVKVKQLFPGQKVAIANDSRPAEVIKRIKKNLYLINLGGTEVEVVRQLIAVNVNGLSKFGPYNTTDTPSTTPDTPSITKEENNEEKKLKYHYEIATAYLPRDLDTSTREAQNKVLELAFKEVVKRITNKNKNPELAARNLFYDEDFPMEVISQYNYYKKHGFPEDTEDEISDPEKAAEEYLKIVDTENKNNKKKI